MEVVASLSQGRTAAAQCDLFTHKSVPVIFEPPCIYVYPTHSYQHCVVLLLLLLRRRPHPLPSCRAVCQLACNNSSFVATIYPLVFGFTHRVHNAERTATWSDWSC